MNIILIDDDEADNYLHKRAIEKSGHYKVLQVFQLAVTALEWLKETDETVDLIFLDINMPIMSGFEFLEQYNSLKESKKAESVIVMLTSSADDRDIKQAEQMGAKYVHKPLTEQVFKSVLTELSN